MTFLGSWTQKLGFHIKVGNDHILPYSTIIL
jgi:hypothetical protein